MRRKNHLVHGWRVDNPSESIGVLEEPLEEVSGEPWRLQNYGYTLLPITTKLKSRKMARKLANRIGPRDVAVGHSNGCAVLLRASHLTKIRTLVLLNPALDKDEVPGRGTETCIVYHSPKDWATRLARFIPGSIWGAMGNVGYQPLKGEKADDRISNVNIMDIPGVESHGHSWFKKCRELASNHIWSTVQEVS